MKRLTIRCDGDEPINVIRAYKITFPPMHFMGGSVPLPVVKFELKPWTPIQGHETREDGSVVSEEVEIRYPEWLVGGQGDPRFIHATVGRVLLVCDVSHPTEVSITTI